MKLTGREIDLLKHGFTVQRFPFPTSSSISHTSLNQNLHLRLGSYFPSSTIPHESIGVTLSPDPLITQILLERSASDRQSLQTSRW